MVGPTSTSAIETRMKNAIPTVNPIATRRTFQSGRPSVMSYAAFSVLMIETIAPELLQIVSRKANVSTPPWPLFEISAIWSVMIFSASGGANRPSWSVTCPMRLSIGKKLAIDINVRSAGNSAKKK